MFPKDSEDVDVKQLNQKYGRTTFLLSVVAKLNVIPFQGPEHSNTCIRMNSSITCKTSYDYLHPIE